MTRLASRNPATTADPTALREGFLAIPYSLVLDSELRDRALQTYYLLCKDREQYWVCDLTLAEIAGSLNTCDETVSRYGEDIVIQDDRLIVGVSRLRNCLHEHFESSKRKLAWVGPLGILATLVGMLVVADFKPLLGLPVEMWQTVFAGFAAACFVWTCFCIIRAIRCLNKGGIDQFIQRLKDGP